ncbi:hypothetical protein [Catenibacterium mitsuokai]|uniref:hypothetical protein n=1 Tax=Catenibacterium mitsuokai TaxID=100886 RepID=UPI0022E74A5B|nr:hypothetical protein [Catenibacterium mitsuokai]
MNTDVKKILDQAKDSYDRYFKDAPKLPEIPGQNVVFDKEKMKEIINKKVNQLEGHVKNLNTLKKELEGESAMVLNNTFPKDKEEYTKTTVNQMLKDYEEERKRIDDLEKKINEIKK